MRRSLAPPPPPPKPKVVFCLGVEMRTGDAAGQCGPASEPMNIQIATLCDAATDYGGKLSLLGTFDTIMARQLPAKHPQCSVALRIVFDRSDEGSHRLRVDLVDADGKSLMPAVDIPFEVRLAADALNHSRNFIINIQQLKFEQPGHYAVAIAVDGEVQTSIPLRVNVQGT